MSRKIPARLTKRHSKWNTNDYTVEKWHDNWSVSCRVLTTTSPNMSVKILSCLARLAGPASSPTSPIPGQPKPIGRFCVISVTSSTNLLLPPWGSGGGPPMPPNINRSPNWRTSARAAAVENTSTGRPDVAESARAESERAQLPRAELARAELERAQLPCAESARAESERAQLPRAESARAESERAQLPRAESERTQLTRAKSERA